MQAAELPKGSLDRLLKVAAYAAAAAYPFHTERVGKPLFSMPGETMEVVLPEKGLRYIVESVSSSGLKCLSENSQWSICFLGILFIMRIHISWKTHAKAENRLLSRSLIHKE